MTNSDNDNLRKIFEELLHAESEEEVTRVLKENNLADPKHWKPLGNILNNKSVVDNQAQEPGGAFVEKLTNAVDAILTKECFLRGIQPDSINAPNSMAEAAEKFLNIPGGNLANLLTGEITKLADNIHVVASGTKQEPCYLIVDKGEGQTPSRFEDTFLSLVKTNKARIRFVQGKFNCGGTGVLPFCGTKSYQLIISRRCPELPSGTILSGPKDETHNAWGFTLIRKLPPSAGLYDTSVYVYLAPNGQIPYFESQEVSVLPESGKMVMDDDDIEDTETGEKKPPSPPRKYQLPLKFGTVVKLYNYRWRAGSLATRDVRAELERYLYQICIPVRVTETRITFKANYYATTVSGTSVTIDRHREKGYLENNFPITGEILIGDIGSLPITLTLYREPNREDKKDKIPKKVSKGIYFTINGQVHYFIGPEFFTTRGLKYELLRDTLLVTIDCSGLFPDIRDQLIMPSRDRLRKLPEFENIIDNIVADLKDRDTLRSINDERKLRRVKQALDDETVQDLFQSLINKDPVFASLFRGGKGLRNPDVVVVGPPNLQYKGKKPPTFFHFENEKDQITKTFSVDRTCAVELLTDAINGYFDLPNPTERGQIQIEPPCYIRRNLFNGRLRIVFRAPSNARIGDSLEILITIKDPILAAAGRDPWINRVVLNFTEGGKEVKPGGKTQKTEGTGALGMPKIIPVTKNQWPEHKFDERSALRIMESQNPDEGYLFFVNMDNIYLQNELIRRKDPDKESAKYAFQWGLVLIALGMLQELKRAGSAKGIQESGNNEVDGTTLTIEDQISKFSTGVAAVIIPVVLNLAELMSTKAEMNLATAQVL